MSNEKEDLVRVKKQVRNLIQRAHELTIKHKKLFANSIVSRELESFANRHLGGFEKKEEEKVPIRSERKKQTVITHTEESFRFDDKKKSFPEVAAEDEKEKLLSEMSMDELKVIAKQEYGLNTRGARNKDQVLHLIEQARILREPDEVEETEEQETETEQQEETVKTEISDPALVDLDKE